MEIDDWIYTIIIMPIVKLILEHISKKVKNAIEHRKINQQYTKKYNNGIKEIKELEMTLKELDAALEELKKIISV